MQIKSCQTGVAATGGACFSRSSSFTARWAASRDPGLTEAALRDAAISYSGPLLSPFLALFLLVRPARVLLDGACDFGLCCPHSSGLRA